MVNTSKTLYQKAVEISAEYLGPAGERFMNRQISTHLNIDPSEMKARELASLINWIKLTFSLLTDDQKIVDAFVTDLSTLTIVYPTSPRVSQHGKH